MLSNEGFLALHMKSRSQEIDSGQYPNCAHHNSKKKQTKQN